MIRYIHGSGNSTDVDVVYVFDRTNSWKDYKIINFITYSDINCDTYLFNINNYRIYAYL